MGLQLALLRYSPLHRAGSEMNTCWCIEYCPVAMPQPLNQAPHSVGAPFHMPPFAEHPIGTGATASRATQQWQHSQSSFHARSPALTVTDV